MSGWAGDAGKITKKGKKAHLYYVPSATADAAAILLHWVRYFSLGGTA